ncbi:MAG TPA: hypothetical protein VHH57_11655, partial [Gaiella sp.]|nr:hypothetical protein [Gaiella sp.]
VGLSNEAAPVRVGDLPLKEIDVLGVSCCGSGEFAEAVDLVSRRREAAAGLVTHEFALERHRRRSRTRSSIRPRS